MRHNIWEITEAQKALREGEYKLAERYLEKALECVWCVYCHEPLYGGKLYRPHFKGYVHVGCAEKYAGRGDYERQHPS